MKANFLKIAKVQELLSKIEENLDAYRSGNFDFLISDTSCHFETSLEIDESKLASISCDKDNLKEVENCILMFEAMGEISHYLARDERLWVYLTHTIMLPYARVRWPIPADDEKAIKHIRTHFFSNGARGIERDNAASRLWWQATLCSRAKGISFSEALTSFLYMSDVRATFAALIDAFGKDKKLKGKIEGASKKLKSSLLDAVKALHPEHVFTVPQEKSNACATFIKAFLDTKGHIYTTNYDLLLYWVLMRNDIMRAVDGFGRDREGSDEYVPPEELEYSELRWGRNKAGQDIFYVHGALPLFDAGVEIVKEEYDNEHYLLEKISERITGGDYPIFVTAGNGHEKLTHIMHNRYLTHCYESLSNITGSLVTFGFNFGDSDDHIIDAINAAAKNGRKIFPKLLSLYVGVYSDADKKHMDHIAGRFKCKVHLYDANSAKVWG